MVTPTPKPPSKRQRKDVLEKAVAELQARIGVLEKVMALEERLHKAETGSHLMDAKQFAARFGVSVKIVRRWVADKKVRPVKINRRVFFREHHLTDLLDRFDLSLTDSTGRKRKR